MSDKPTYLPPAEAAKILGVHSRTLRLWEIRGEIKAIKTPSGKRRYDVQSYQQKYIPEEQTDAREGGGRATVTYARQEGEGEGEGEVRKTFMSSFEDLQVWQKAINLATEIYKFTESFPAKYQYSLISQLQRSSLSVPSNIAEGYGRNSTGDYIQFLGIARGSVNEVITQLIVAKRVGATDRDIQSFINECNEISRMLSAMIKTLSQKKKDDL